MCKYACNFFTFSEWKICILVLCPILLSWKDFMKKIYLSKVVLCKARFVVTWIVLITTMFWTVWIMYLSSMKCVKNNLNSSLEIALVSFNDAYTYREERRNCSLVIKVWYCIAVFDKVKTSAAKGYIRIQTKVLSEMSF